jgi:hypothetical protein
MNSITGSSQYPRNPVASYFALAEHPLEQIPVGNIAAHRLFRDATVLHAFALRNPVAHQANNPGVDIEELRNEP